MKELPPAPSGSVSDIKAIKPEIKSVLFHVYGNELAVTVTGDNLWFCTEVKVNACRQSITAGSTSEKSLQFNVEGKDNFPSTSDHVQVKLWSQFSSPVINSKTEVKHKVSSLPDILTFLMNFASHFIASNSALLLHASGLNITVRHWSKTAHLRTMTSCLHSWSDIVSGQCKINTSG